MVQAAPQATGPPSDKGLSSVAMASVSSSSSRSPGSSRSGLALSTNVRRRCILTALPTGTANSYRCRSSCSVQTGVRSASSHTGRSQSRVSEAKDPNYRAPERLYNGSVYIGPTTRISEKESESFKSTFGGFGNHVSISKVSQSKSSIVPLQPAFPDGLSKQVSRLGHYDLPSDRFRGKRIRQYVETNKSPPLLSSTVSLHLKTRNAINPFLPARSSANATYRSRSADVYNLSSSELRRSSLGRRASLDRSDIVQNSRSGNCLGEIQSRNRSTFEKSIPIAVLSKNIERVSSSRRALRKRETRVTESTRSTTSSSDIPTRVVSGIGVYGNSASNELTSYSLSPTTVAYPSSLLPSGRSSHASNEAALSFSAERQPLHTTVHEYKNFRLSPASRLKQRDLLAQSPFGLNNQSVHTGVCFEVNSGSTNETRSALSDRALKQSSTFEKQEYSGRGDTLYASPRMPRAPRRTPSQPLLTREQCIRDLKQLQIDLASQGKSGIDAVHTGAVSPRQPLPSTTLEKSLYYTKPTFHNATPLCGEDVLNEGFGYRDSVTSCSMYSKNEDGYDRLQTTIQLLRSENGHLKECVARQSRKIAVLEAHMERDENMISKNLQRLGLIKREILRLQGKMGVSHPLAFHLQRILTHFLDSVDTSSFDSQTYVSFLSPSRTINSVTGTQNFEVSPVSYPEEHRIRHPVSPELSSCSPPEVEVPTNFLPVSNDVCNTHTDSTFAYVSRRAKSPRFLDRFDPIRLEATGEPTGASTTLQSPQSFVLNGSENVETSSERQTPAGAADTPPAVNMVTPVTATSSVRCQNELDHSPRTTHKPNTPLAFAARDDIGSQHAPAATNNLTENFSRRDSIQTSTSGTDSDFSSDISCPSVSYPEEEASRSRSFHASAKMPSSSTMLPQENRKRPPVPLLGLEKKNVGFGLWLSGEATQGDTYNLSIDHTVPTQ